MSTGPTEAARPGAASAGIDRGRLWRLLRAPVHRPTDVLNLIDYADRRFYLWYGAFVLPTIYGVGGSIRWGGEHRSSLLGDPVGHTLLVVRYPTHRHFLLMTVNPYFALINHLRVRGVSRFAASFTRVLVPDTELRRCE